MSGYQLWHETELGKALEKVLPPKITRVIIDIPVDGAAKIYYSSVDCQSVLNLNWDEIIQYCEIVKLDDKITNNIETDKNNCPKICEAAKIMMEENGYV